MTIHRFQRPEWVLVTPEYAAQLLAGNTHNRDISLHHVIALAEDMAAGAWDRNGETIKIAADGTVIDGQHRLLACIRSGCSFWTLIVTDLPSVAVQESVDTGLVRGLGAVLKLRGESNYVPLAATIRSIALWESGNRTMSGGSSFSRKHLLSVLDRYPWIREGMSVVQSLARIGLPKSVGGLTWWLFQQINPDDADFFFSRLNSDEGHFAGEPIFELRRYLIANRAARSGEKRGAYYTLALTIKAWNKFRDGESVKLLVYRPGGANPEQFPEPR